MHPSLTFCPRSLHPCARLFLEKDIEDGVFFQWGPVLPTQTLLPQANFTGEGMLPGNRIISGCLCPLSPIMLRRRFEK